MNKNKLVTQVAEQSGLSKGDAGKAVDAVFDAIVNALKDGEEVRMVGFGSFVAYKRKAREGRNPRTGAVLKISESVQIRFKAGKILRDILN